MEYIGHDKVKAFCPSPNDRERQTIKAKFGGYAMYGGQQIRKKRPFQHFSQRDKGLEQS